MFPNNYWNNKNIKRNPKPTCMKTIYKFHPPTVRHCSIITVIVHIIYNVATLVWKHTSATMTGSALTYMHCLYMKIEACLFFFFIFILFFAILHSTVHITQWIYCMDLNFDGEVRWNYINSDGSNDLHRPVWVSATRSSAPMGLFSTLLYFRILFFVRVFPSFLFYFYSHCRYIWDFGEKNIENYIFMYILFIIG